VRGNAQILDGFIDALDLQDVAMAVHDVGGPLGFLAAARQILAGVLRTDPMMAEVERSLPAPLAGLPMLTLFGRKNDPYGWQDRFGQIFPHATAAGIPDGHHFPFNDDPDGSAAAISAWWAEKVATAPGKNL
jgi:pimeloyl-ACP methyl ester carboxylesterase